MYPNYIWYPHNLSSIYPEPYSQYTAPLRYILSKSSESPHYRYLSPAEADFINMNRLLWEEHVSWTRMTIISIVFNLPDLPFVQKRLLQNAADLANCLRPFYGNQTADQYAKLIQEHLVIAAELVTAAVNEESETVAEKEKELYRNADDIARFLSQINPYLQEEMVRQMFYTHLDLTKQEAVMMIEGNYQQDIDIFDEIEAQALEMSDMIAKAIIMQFPHVFL